MDCGVMHGRSSRIGLRRPYIRCFGMVDFLHFVRRKSANSRGLGLPEVLVALTVFGVGVLGVAAVGASARRLAEIAAVRSAQALAGEMMFRHGFDGWPAARWDTVIVGGHRMSISADTVRVAADLLEIRLRIGGSGPAGPWDVVSRQREASP